MYTSHAKQACKLFESPPNAPRKKLAGLVARGVLLQIPNLLHFPNLHIFFASETPFLDLAPHHNRLALYTKTMKDEHRVSLLYSIQSTSLLPC
jgi:hypothetical protein